MKSLIWLCGEQEERRTAWYMHRSVYGNAVFLISKFSYMEEGTEMNVIEAENLSKTFRVKRKEKGMKGSIRAVFKPKTEEIKAVNGISFAVEEGEALAFIGPNDAGKSTTIKMLTGILYPDGGRVQMLGIDPTKKRKQLAYRIGTVFGQKEQLWTHLRVGELTEIFDLSAFINTPVRNLSLGQRIRCEIAVSLLHRPKVLFLGAAFGHRSSSLLPGIEKLFFREPDGREGIGTDR